MDSWSKLSARCARSLDLAELADDCPQAFILYTYMIASGGVWGRYHSDPRVLKASCCPLVESLTRRTVAEAVAVLEARGMLLRYPDDGGNDCLAIASYHKHNPSHSWSRCAAPEYPHPPGWTPPESLVAYFAKVAEGKFKDREKQPISLQAEAARLRCIVTSHSDSPAQVTVTAHHARHTAVRGTGAQKETETEAETESTPLVGANDPADAGGADNGADAGLHLLPLPEPLTADGGNGKREPPKEAMPQRAGTKVADLQEEREQLVAVAEAGGLWGDIDGIVGLIAGTRKSGAMALSVEVAHIRALVQATQKYGVSAVRYGIEEAIRREKFSTAYARACAKGFAREEGDDGETE